MTPQPNRNIKIMTWNAQGIKHKIPELALFLQEHEVDIALIQETFLRPAGKLTIPNYKTVRTDRITRRGGSNAIIIKKTIPHDVIEIPDFASDATFVMIRDGKRQVLVGSIYHSPESGISFEEYNKLFERFPTAILGGDFNAKRIPWGNLTTNTHGRTLHLIIEKNDLNFISPGEPTHFWPENQFPPETLDIFLSKNVELNFKITAIHELTSDHIPVTLQLENISNPDTDPPDKTIINWGKYKDSLMNEDTPTPTLTTCKEINQEISNFTRTIRNAIEAATSLKFTKQNNCKTVIPPEIREIIKTKNKLLRRARSTLDPDIKRQANTLTQKVKTLLTEYKNTKWQDTIKRLSHKDQSLWKMTQALTSTRSSALPQIKYNNKTAYTHSEKTELLADFFAEQFKINNIPNQTERDQAFQTTIDIFDTIKDVPPQETTTSEEVRSIIQNLGTKKAPGPDGVTPAMLKHLPENQIHKLTHIFNAALKISYFPDPWKIAHTILIPKQGKPRTSPEAYRPISLLSSTGKVLERIILTRIQEFTEEFDILPQEQFGFRKQHSTTHQTVRLTEEITGSLNKGFVTAAVMLDVSQAFDRVWHDGLIMKLIRNGFPNPLIKIVKSFLQNRTFHIKIEQNSISSTRPLEAGVPQGSPLSPTLYSIYTADAPRNQHTALFLYADDTAITCSHRDPKVAIKRTQDHLNEIHKWATKWKIKLNPQKTQAIVFSNKNKMQKKNLTLEGKTIPWKDKVKYLGLLYDKKLVWKDQVNHIKQKTAAALGKLYPLLTSEELNLRTKLLIYTQIIRPAITYGAPSFSYISTHRLKSLSAIQNKILRRITKAPWYVKNKHIHHDLNMPTLLQYMNQVKQSFFESCENNQNHLIQSTLNYDPAQKRGTRPHPKIRLPEET